MKKILASIALATMMIGCGPDYKSQIEQLKSEKDSLALEFSIRDSTINSYMKDINEIQEQINQLTVENEILTERINGNELSGTQKDKILQDIKSLNDLIQLGKNKISSLESKIKKSNTKIQQLEKMIASLNGQLEERDSSVQNLLAQIAVLNGRISQLDTIISLANIENERKRAEISDKTKRLNTGYFVVGDYKKLKNENVLSQEGKFLGMVKNKSINSNFNQEVFTKIDITDTKIIDVYSTKAELLSTHPSGSYELIKQNGKIVAIEIVNSDKFWQASKYLVIMTN